MSINKAERDLLAHATSTEALLVSGGLGSIQQEIGQFAREERGNVAIMFAMMASVMIGLTGLAVDFGRWINARDQTVSAMDAAVLAAGRALQTNGSDTAKAVTVAQQYYKSGTVGRIPTYNDNINFTTVTDSKGTTIVATGNAYIKAPFIVTSYNMIKKGQGSGTRANNLWPLLASGTPSADASKAIVAVGGNGGTSLEISMMLDVSGSMGTGTKFADMKSAAKDLLDIVIWADQSKYQSRVALVPFSADVRLSPSMLTAVSDSALLGSYQENLTGSTKTYNKTGCVVERGGSDRYTDAAPAAGKYISVGYDATGTSGNGNCSTPTASAVVPMSNDKTMLKDKVENLVLGGGTGGHIGTAWAYYMVSPKWANIVGASSAGSSYGAAKVKKIAILMTDGEYNIVYRPVKQCKKSNGSLTSCSGGSIASTTYISSMGIDDSGTATDSINAADSPTQALAICSEMRNNTIEVFTVGFDLGGNTTAINTLQNCASDASHFYNASNGEQLKQAFRDIALKVSSLYLTQ